MKILGINETTHDASVALIEDGEILFAGHAERYSKVKNDWFTNNDLIRDAVSYGYPDYVAYYEKPMLKKTRLMLAGGFGGDQPFFKQTFIANVPRKYFSHHHSHAAAGYYTSSFDDALIVVLDAIGEWNTSSVWVGSKDNIKKISAQNYPFSFGLFYSAFTQLIGLKPNEEEYILMGMAGYGDYKRYWNKVNEYFSSIKNQKYNFHRGIYDWEEPIIDQQTKFDIAAAVQKVYEIRLIEFMHNAKVMTGKTNLVFMGGCALNSSANTLLLDMFENVWIMPNPGDAGSSLGAAAALYGHHLNWRTPYLGHNLSGDYPIKQALSDILEDKITAVASGRAEYGPRALGNRSILADPRYPEIQGIVNKIKQRELFRPFAPVVMEEYAHEWFDMQIDASPYMQYTFKCKQPEKIPAVVHIDGTSRVQTVNKNQHPGLWKLIEEFKEVTGIPVLLNTSLNVKGQPLLNDVNDMINWEKIYNHPIRN
jgi:carbamoyltransferase